MDELKKHIKNWDIRTILGRATSTGMGFMVNKISEEELSKERQIMVEEIESRILSNNQ